MRCPCIECHEKGCGEKHDTCEGYQAWKKEHDSTQEWLRDQKHTVPDGALKGHYKKIKHDKSRKWNVKTRNGGDGKW